MLPTYACNKKQLVAVCDQIFKMINLRILMDKFQKYLRITVRRRLP